VLVDLSLPDVHGLELIKQLVAKSESMAILVLSMYDDAVFAERALRAGARGFINKRESMETLLDAVRRVLAGEVWLSPRASSLVLKGFVSRRRPDQGADRLAGLSDRELEVLQELGAGRSTREIAQ